MAKKALLIIVLLHICQGEETESPLPPVIMKLPRTITEEITGDPIFSMTTHAYSNAFAAAVNSATWVPQAFATALGPVAQSNLPIKMTSPNRMQQFMDDFNKASCNADAKLQIYDLITKNGFDVEVHHVITGDGYELTMYRIPNNRSAVFLMHGLLGSADDFVVAGRKSGLAYLLARGGYDVWLGNARGNKHSRKHIELDPSDAAFWDFSWHEIGVYDLPAMIDYTLNVTNQSSLRYIGYSQGSTSFFVMASERPEYNEKVSLMIALSPVAYMAHVRSPTVRLLAPGTYILRGLSQSLGLHEFLPDSKLIRALKILICGNNPVAEVLCSNILFITSGFDFNQLNVSNLPVILNHMPAGASMKQIAHYGQGVLSKEFRKFDYGTQENVVRYGVVVPPNYSVENIETPTALLFSENDWMAHEIDVKRLYSRLGNVIDYYKVPLKKFNHIDFLIAKDIVPLVYKRVLKLLYWSFK